jgi:trimeric autotransporter adhesin
MLQFRKAHHTVLTLVGVSVALVMGCSDAVDPSVHGASSTVVGPATQIQIAPSSATLTQGARSLLRCAAFDAQGVMLSSAPVWTSSDPNTASVASDGSVTAVHQGTASATCQIGGRSATSLITVSSAQVAFVEVSPGAGTIPNGGTIQLSGVPRDSLGLPVAGSNVQWASGDTTIATVTPDGVVTARGNGAADIVATSSGVAGSTRLSVSGTPLAPVASIQLSIDQNTLNSGRFTHATATPLDAQGHVLSGRSIKWSTSNSDVLMAYTLNATRSTVIGLAQGTASLTATSEGQSASVTVVVGVPTVASVVASLASPSIVVGQTTLASAVPEDGVGNPLSGHTVTWASLDPTIATVSSSGVVTGVAPGAVIIRATSDGVTGDASLTVTLVPVASVTTTVASGTLTVGQSTQGTAVARDANGNTLTGRSVAWSSLNTAVATVSISGLITAVAPGNATIRATIESQHGDANVVVSAPAAPPAPTVASVAVTFDSSSIAKGHTSMAHATVRDGQGNVMTGKSPSWVSTNTSVASVSGGGMVTGAATGTAVIQATVDGVSGSGSLPVTTTSTSSPSSPPPASPTTASVAVTFDSSSIAKGHTSQAKATAKDAQGNVLTGKTATWASTNTSIATVSSAGVVTGVSAGTAGIQATIDGITSSGSLSVTAPPAPPAPPAPTTASVVVTFDSSSVAVGHTSQAKAVAKDASGNVLSGKTATWTSKTTSIASVSTAGVVTGVAAGTATIQATIDGVNGTGTLTVNTGNAITAPPPSSSGTALASANFDDGTFGQFASGGSGVDIVADPTSRATGKVARIHFANNPSAGNLDANLAVWPNGVPSVGLGDSLWFAGDFYVDNTQDAMRKLTYWSGSCGVQFITTLQPGFGADSNQFYMDVEGAQSRSTYTTFVRTRAWHHFVVSMRVNSSTSAADGLARAWIDGTLVATMTGVQWISSSGCAFNSWGVGYQAQASYAISEYRYWDNVIYSKSPLN